MLAGVWEGGGRGGKGKGGAALAAEYGDGPVAQRVSVRHPPPPTGARLGGLCTGTCPL